MIIYSYLIYISQDNKGNKISLCSHLNDVIYRGLGLQIRKGALNRPTLQNHIVFTYALKTMSFSRISSRTKLS